jgi:hypothetical protein
MAFVPKEGSGSLFKNNRKTTENHPDLSGTIMLGGKEFWLSAWKKDGKNGPFYSVSIGKEKLPMGFKEAGADELPKHTLEDSDLPF